MLSNIVGIQSNQKEITMKGIKRYILTIEYNTDTEEIEYIQEEIVDNEEFFEYGDFILDDYFDEETLELLEDSYILGIS
tara:strand:- start:608 stop:844 length:237 start_codon:yes stop_codon:yes gene_type:complete